MTVTFSSTIPVTPSLCKSIVVPYDVDTNEKVTNYFPFCTIGISMYQKRILPYIIIPYSLTPSFFPFGAFQTYEQRDRFQHPFHPYFFFFPLSARGPTAGLTIFPTFVALVHKKTYVECTKYVRRNTPATASSRQPQTTNKKTMAVASGFCRF